MRTNTSGIIIETFITDTKSDTKLQLKIPKYCKNIYAVIHSDNFFEHRLAYYEIKKRYEKKK